METNILPAASFSRINECTTTLEDIVHKPEGPIFDFAEFPVWNATTLTRLVGDNPPMHLRLLEKFLVSAQNQVDTILSAAMAENTTNIYKVAHALKSAARTVGAIQLGELCHELEVAGKANNIRHCTILVGQLNDIFNAAADKIKQVLN